MSRFKTLSSLLSLALLTACGGGSDSNSAEGNNNGNLPLVSLSADVVQETVCGTTVASSNAELLIHDSNWQVLSRHRADANGKISANFRSAANVNLSFITYSTGNNAQINVVSYAQHPIGDLGLITVPGQSPQGCECREIDVSVKSLGNSLAPSRVRLSGHSGIAEFQRSIGIDEVLFEGVNICRAANGNWPVLVASTSSTIYTTNDFLTYTTPPSAGMLKQYNDGSDVETIILENNYTILPVTANSTDIYIGEVHHTDSTTNYFSNSALIDRNEVYVFNELEAAKIIAIRGVRYSYDYIDNIRVTYSESQRVRYPLPYNGEFHLDIPNSDAQQALKDFFVYSLSSESTQYNLGSVQQFNTFYLDAFTTLTDGTRYNQSFIGPLQGNYPDEIVPEDYNIDSRLDEDASASIIASLIRYGDEQSYQQYLAAQVKRSRLPFTERMVGEWSKYSTVSLSLTSQ